jgi:hypothetical protein
MSKLNAYMLAKLNDVKDVLDLDMLDIYYKDAKLASDLGVTSDEEYKDFHYIDAFVDNILEQAIGVRLSEDEESLAKKWIYKHRKEFNLCTLEGYYNAVSEYINFLKRPRKTAYPNESYFSAKRSKDIGWDWINLAKKIQSLILKGNDSRSALLNAASALDLEQKYDFMIWYKFRFGGDGNKYDLNARIMQKSEGLMEANNKYRNRKVAFQYDAESHSYYIPNLNPPIPDASKQIRLLQPDEVIQKEKDREALEFARSKLVSRTFAIDKMLEKNREVIPPQQFEEIEDALNALRKKIRGLKHASSINDCLIKTANKFGSLQFDPGKIALSEFAEKYSEDLQQKGPFVKKALDQLSPMINDLQIIDAELKRRDIARAISKIDFQLAEMNLAGLFTELSEAQSRLIDAYTYASNKVKEVIPKMRSTQPGMTDRPAGPGAMSNIRTPSLNPLQPATQTYQSSAPVLPPKQTTPSVQPTQQQSAEKPSPPSSPAMNRLQQSLI